MDPLTTAGLVHPALGCRRAPISRMHFTGQASGSSPCLPDGDTPQTAVWGFVQHLRDLTHFLALPDCHGRPAALWEVAGAGVETWAR